MSADPEAILYYGIDLGGVMEEKYMTAEYDYHEANTEWEAVHRPAQPADKSNYATPEWNAWREKLAVYEATPEHVEMSWFGAESCERFVVLCPCLKVSVEWAEQHEFSLGHVLQQQPEADEWIRKYCEQFGFPFKQPAWHLAARYF